MATATPLCIGVLLTGEVQLLDVAPVDLFGMLTPQYLKACKLPASLEAQAIPIEITYISEVGGNNFAPLTANAAIRATASPSDDIASAKNIDILYIPGPDPSDVPSEEIKDYPWACESRQHHLGGLHRYLLRSLLGHI